MGKIKIIAGKYRNRNIKAFDTMPARPLLSRVKKSIFDILMLRLAGSFFLDLFSGTGSVGLEALSRGAGQVTFVEKDFNLSKLIADNLNLLGIKSGFEIKNFDAIYYLSGLNRSFDIIFSGPPYFSGLNVQILELIARKNILKKEGILIMQLHYSEKYPEEIENILKCTRQEKYGDMRILFYENRTI